MNDEDQRLVDQFSDGESAYSMREKLLKEQAFIEMRAELIRKFELTTYDQETDRTEIWRKMQVVAWFDGILTDIIQTGKIAADDMKMSDKFKNFFKR